MRRGDLTPIPVWASEAIDLISDLPPAADLVSTLAAGAEAALGRLLGIGSKYGQVAASRELPYE